MVPVTVRLRPACASGLPSTDTCYQIRHSGGRTLLAIRERCMILSSSVSGCACRHLESIRIGRILEVLGQKPVCP